MKSYESVKPPKTPEKHLEKFKERGLIVPDEERALRYLRFIGYYRLGGYKAPYEELGKEHVFISGTTFDDILSLYIFDRKLRLLTMDAIERIEVAIRATIVDTCSLLHGSHWFTKSDMFSSQEAQSELLAKIKRNVERNKNQQPFRHYYETYSSPELPPSWMISDVVDFTSWSTVYKFIDSRATKKTIASYYDLGPTHLESWLQVLCLVRNVCAHHSKLWDRYLVKAPAQIARLKGVKALRRTSYCAAAIVIWDILTHITRNSGWTMRLHSLLDKECPLDYHEYMGFPHGWEKIPFWGLYPPVSET